MLTRIIVYLSIIYVFKYVQLHRVNISQQIKHWMAEFYLKPDNK